MNEFLKDYVSMLVECGNNNVEEKDTYKDLTDKDYENIINEIKNDDNIWDTFDYAILEILEEYKNE